MGMLTKTTNKFQFGKEGLYLMMKSQVGVKGSAPLTSINGHWPQSPKTFSFQIVEVHDDNKFVATALCDDGKYLQCTPSFFLRNDVHVEWSTQAGVWRTLRDTDSNYANAMGRARSIATEYIKKRKETGVEDDVIVTLDGIGNNIHVLQDVFLEVGLACPRIIICERDAVHALCQRLCGYEVVYTGGDPNIRSTKKGSCRPLLEDFALRGRLPVKNGKVTLLYLDYCGGPPTHVNMTEVLLSFPNLLVYAATVSRRQHPGVEDHFETYIPKMYGFCSTNVFLNRGVVCKMFSLDKDVDRHVLIPGCFWYNCPKELKRKKYFGVMIDINTAAVRTERGIEHVHLNHTAFTRYKIASPIMNRHVAVPGCFWNNCPKHLKRKLFKGVMVGKNAATVRTEKGIERIFLNDAACKRYKVATPL